MGRLKILLTLVLSATLLLAVSASVMAAEINQDERRILNQFKEEPFASHLDKRYINQFENYFSRDDVTIDKDQADSFIDCFSKAIVKYKNSGGKGPIFNQSLDSFKYFQYAGANIGLYLQYDTNTDKFCAVDGNGYVVIDTNKVIKDTGDSAENKKSTEKSWGVSVEVIFAGVIFLIFIGFVVNAKKWMKRIRKHSAKNYDDEEDEMEVANRKTRRARLQTFSYNNFKQIVKYLYVPVLMCLVLAGIVILFFRPYAYVMKNIKDGFIQNLTINTYSEHRKDFTNTPLIKDKTISGDKVSWPKYTEPYGIIKCDKIKLKAPMYMGDSDYVLGGRLKGKVENDYSDDFETELGEDFKGAAGTYLGSSIPGDGKTILMGAHDTTYFKPLEKVKKGMVMDVRTDYARYKYKVRDIRIYDKDELDEAYNLQAKKEQLVLYTCYPFGKLNGDKSKRMFVYLDKTFGPSIDKEVKK